MSRKTSHYGFLPLLMLVVALLGVAPGEAVSFALADRDREQAIRAGKKSIVLEEFGAEWRLRDASGQTLVVMTPFHRLALAARNSAFRGEEIKPRDIESVLKEYVRMDRECTDKAKDLLHQAGDAVQSAASTVGHKAEDAVDDLTRLIRRYPMQSVLAGLGIGFLLSQVMRSHDR